MEKDILDELRRLNSKMDRLLDVLSNDRTTPIHKSNESRGDQIKLQVQEQIAAAKREIGNKLPSTNFNFPISNI